MRLNFILHAKFCQIISTNSILSKTNQQMKLLFPALLCFSICKAQLPETDIFLCDFKIDGKNISCSEPKNITNRKGYDNQPSFSSNDALLYFVQVPDSTQSDVYSYDMKSKKIVAITQTSVSEYSPRTDVDQNTMTVVRVDADTGQRAYHISMKDQKATVIPNTDSIGYFCSLNDSTMAMFILGDAMTLQLLNLKNHERTLIASDIGRCMKLNPAKKEMYYVLKSNKDEWNILSLNLYTLKSRFVTATMTASEDYEVLPDGRLIMGSGAKLFVLNPAIEGDSWLEIADFSKTLNGFYRLSLSHDAKHLALVAYTGEKP